MAAVGVAGTTHDQHWHVNYSGGMEGQETRRRTRRRWWRAGGPLVLEVMVVQLLALLQLRWRRRWRRRRDERTDATAVRTVHLEVMDLPVRRWLTSGSEWQLLVTGGGGGGASNRESSGGRFDRITAAWTDTATGFIAGPGGGGGGSDVASAATAGRRALWRWWRREGSTAAAGRNGVIVITYYVPSRRMKLFGKLKILNGARLKINQAQ